MLFILRWLRSVLRLRRSPPPPLPLPEPTPATAFDPEPEPEPVVTGISSNRHERRALERARRKYDKFVTPRGAPAKKPRPETQQIKPRPKKIEVITPTDAVEDAEYLIADGHHENRSDRVLYKEAELYGEFSFRDTILQQLERYFVYLGRMKKHDPDAYGYYREVGATILPYLATNAWNRKVATDDEAARKRNTPLAEYFNKTRPSFGCFVYGADPETEKFEQQNKDKKGNVFWVPKFMYFRKYKRPPPELQMISGGDIYTMTIWWDRPFDKKIQYGKPQEFGIFISHDGSEVIALKSCHTKYITMPSKKERPTRKQTPFRRRELGHITVPTKAWHIPGEFESWAHDHDDDAQHFLTELFKESIQRNEMSQYSMTRVAATRGAETAVFSVNIRRTSYFFQDRDVTVGEDGSRKRIFHFVRPHVRADGTEVKAHFRGEREFSWAGYDIKITVPGRDHFDLADMDLGAEDEYWWEGNPKKMLGMPELGKKLKGWMNEGRGARR
jgi:hypothetical protein